MNRADYRTGFTLVELVAVISIGSVIMLLAIAWIGETMKFASRTVSHQRQHQQLTRLSRNLRTDVRMSQSMTIENDRQLVLQGAEGKRISYTISGTTIEMEDSGENQTRRECYRLVAGSRIQWDTSGMPNSIGLIVNRVPHGLAALTTNPDALGSNNRNTNNSEGPAAIPIDIHIYAHANRWDIQYAAEHSVGGAR